MICKYLTENVELGKVTEECIYSKKLKLFLKSEMNTKIKC
jgi:hypothetical protein